MNNNESAAMNNVETGGVRVPAAASEENNNKTPAEMAQERRLSSEWRGSREQRNLIEDDVRHGARVKISRFYDSSGTPSAATIKTSSTPDSQTSTSSRKQFVRSLLLIKR
jgi:hypothetical protein